MSIKKILGIGCLLLGAIVSEVAMAQGGSFPVRPMRFFVPYAPGGVGDLTARIVAQKMSEHLGQPVVIENRPGAGMVIGTSAVAKAEPDGYTMGLTGNGHTLAHSLFKSLPYDISKDFAHVSTIGFFDLAIFVSPKSNFRTLEDLINHAKANPGKVNIGSISIGSTQHLAAELFKSMSGIDATVVPFRSSADVIAAAIGQTVDASVEILAPLMGQIRGDLVRPLAVTSKSRFASFPNIPTVSERAVPGYEAASWNGVSVPAGTPEGPIQRLNEAVNHALAQPDVKARMLELGVSSRGSSSIAMRDLINADIAKWKAVIDRSNIPRQ